MLAKKCWKPEYFKKHISWKTRFVSCFKCKCTRPLINTVLSICVLHSDWSLTWSRIVLWSSWRRSISRLRFIMRSSFSASCSFNSTTCASRISSADLLHVKGYSYIWWIHCQICKQSIHENNSNHIELIVKIIAQSYIATLKNLYAMIKK